MAEGLPDRAARLAAALRREPEGQALVLGHHRSIAPPVIQYFLVNKPVLFPPNHRMVDVKLIYGIEDRCDTGLVPTITISSNQPTNDGGSPDWEVVDAHHIRLRAEVSPGRQ